MAQSAKTHSKCTALPTEIAHVAHCLKFGHGLYVLHEMRTLSEAMFPAQALEDAIRDEIVAAANDRPTPRGAWEPAVDSLTIVRVVCRVEEELGIKLPDDVMLRGGFEDVDHCVTVVMTASRQLWDLKYLVEEEV